VSTNGHKFLEAFAIESERISDGYRSSVEQLKGTIPYVILFNPFDEWLLGYYAHPNGDLGMI